MVQPTITKRYCETVVNFQEKSTKQSVLQQQKAANISGRDMTIFNFELKHRQTLTVFVRFEIHQIFRRFLEVSNSVV